MNLTALGGFGAWDLRRRDRWFEEAREDRRRIETGVDSQEANQAPLESSLVAGFASLSGRMDQLESSQAAGLASLSGRFDGLEAGPAAGSADWVHGWSPWSFPRADTSAGDIVSELLQQGNVRTAG